MISVKDWTEAMWSEWASTTHQLLSLPALPGPWPRIWNKELENRIDTVLRIYGVPSIFLDTLAREHNERTTQHTALQSPSPASVPMLQEPERDGPTYLLDVPPQAEEQDTSVWQRLRRRFDDLVRCHREWSSHS